MAKKQANPNTSPQYGGDTGTLLSLKLLDGGHCFIDATRVTAIVDCPAVKGIGGDIPRRTRINLIDVPCILVTDTAEVVGVLVESYVRAAQRKRIRPTNRPPCNTGSL